MAADTYTLTVLARANGQSVNRLTQWGVVVVRLLAIFVGNYLAFVRSYLYDEYVRQPYLARACLENGIIFFFFTNGGIVKFLRLLDMRFQGLKTQDHLLL